MRVVIGHISGPHAYSEALLMFIRASHVQLFYMCGIGRNLHRVLVARQGLLLTALVLAVQLVHHTLRSR